MNAPPPALAGWTRRRFWAVVGVFCVAQAGLIMLFAERGNEGAPLTHGPADFHLMAPQLSAAELTKTFFATDPIVFALPSLHGFSGRAWLELPPPQSEMPIETGKPEWLALDMPRLGTSFPTLEQAKSPLPFSLAGLRSPELEPWPAFLAPEVVKTRSGFEMKGELSRRLINKPAALPSWPSDQLLAKSVVEIAVDSSGRVVATRLQTPRWGWRSAEADASALEMARRLRFRPVASPGPAWGEAVFQWQTTEPTNTSPAISREAP
jgi:hypothetical protein